MISNPRHSRRGALLLVVLFVLVLLLLLGMSFLKVASQFSRTASSTLRASRNEGYEPRQLMNTALMQVVRGTGDPESAVHGHSLLGDLYGNDGLRVRVESVTHLANRQFQKMTFFGPEVENHTCDACVVTLKDRSGRHQSGRILQWLGSERTLISEDLHDVQAGDELLINGYPFNAKTNARDDSNYQFAEPDEPWDAVDEHNLALARLGQSEADTIPSYHRGSSLSKRIHREAIAFDPERGPWDVDNDGDGLTDSVWVDFGLTPVRLEGNVVAKPLVAALIVDLDGRLNVNAHGNLGQLRQLVRENPEDIRPAGKALGVTKTQGGGYGPAEVDLTKLFARPTDYELLLGARYGISRANIDRRFELASNMLQADMISTRDPDFSGTAFVYLDAEGQPFQAGTVPLESPYRFAPGKTNSTNKPFDTADLEWVLRSGEYGGSQLRSRLQGIVDPATARSVTTSSVSIPFLPKIGDEGIVSTLMARLRKRGVPESEIENQLRLMLPPEILRGEKMNLNRPFIADDGQELTSSEQLQAAKGLFARHLYCLLMCIAEEDAVVTTNEQLNSNDARKLFAIQLAQWCVNVVDYRDADGVSTPFEFDINPFDGWHVNGSLKNKRLDESTEEDRDQREVVWGMERPELIMTESLALHDRMVGDFEVGGKRSATSPDERDDDLDQIRHPRGMLLVELKSPHSTQATAETDPSWPRPIDPTGSTNSSGLYFRNANSSTPILDMDKSQVGAGGHAYSVWRIAISERHGKDTMSTFRMSQTAPDSARPEPDTPLSLVDRDAAQLRTERIISLSSRKPTETHPHYGRMYCTETIPGFWPYKAQLPVGETAVITPFINLTIGQGKRGSTPWLFERAKQKFVFVGAGKSVVEFETESGDVGRHAALPIMATSGSVRTNRGVAPAVGVSVSEPIPAVHAEVYGDEKRSVLRDRPDDTHPLAPLAQDKSLRRTHTDPDFKTLFLQRLANPGLGWNPPVEHPLHDHRMPVNPYITVDWMPVQLSVFNSALMPAEIEAWNPTDGDFDPDDPAFDDTDFRHDEQLQFSSVEWTGEIQNVDAITRSVLHPIFSPRRLSNFWGASPTSKPHRSVKPSAQHFQRPPLRLGHSIGVASNFTEALDRSGKRVEIPRPWIAWNNRDFANRFELLNVPKSSSARFRMEFALPKDESRPQFGHLLNFFDEHRLHLLFDHVHVPSRFAAADKLISPSEDARELGFGGPFSSRSRFRDVGKVNLKTVSDVRVAEAISASSTIVDRNDESNDPLALIRYTKREKSPGLHNNPLRNSYFHHLPIQKLGAVASNQSNVYAIWLTVGFFELEPSLESDGYRVGSELHAVGTQRHRIFAILDRSIPVAFEMGSDHNAMDTVVLKRLLE